DDDVGILPQDVSQGLLERRGIREDFLLDDNARLVVVNKLDRVFDGDDLGAAAAVDHIHKVVERGGLAITRGAGHQNESIGKASQLVDDGGQAKLLAGADRQLAEPDGHLGDARVQVNAGTTPAHSVPEP